MSETLAKAEITKQSLLSHAKRHRDWPEEIRYFELLDVNDRSGLLFEIMCKDWEAPRVFKFTHDEAVVLGGLGGNPDYTRQLLHGLKGRPGYEDVASANLARASIPLRQAFERAGNSVIVIERKHLNAYLDALQAWNPTTEFNLRKKLELKQDKRPLVFNNAKQWDFPILIREHNL